jgi:sulfate transport system substrate-binding protein
VTNILAERGIVARWSLILVGLYVLVAGAWLAAGGVVRENTGQELLNVSYDPTRELWREINQAFAMRYANERGVRLTIKQSHGGSGSQARAVIDGLDADVVTLAMWTDVDAIRQKGLIEAGWQARLPEQSLPYYSTIVFVVRQGNPRAIRDWSDLVRPGVSIITPNPRTSGNGRLSLFAAWGAVKVRGGSDDAALAYLAQLYRQVPVLDSGARGSTTTFGQKHQGDVLLAWENEAHLLLREASGEHLEIVYPPVSIKAEPFVAVVDANVKRKGTRAAAEAYLKFLYTEEGQEIIARHCYRPTNAAVLQRHTGTLRAIELFPITAVARDWAEAQTRFCGEGGIFDKIYAK